MMTMSPVSESKMLSSGEETSRDVLVFTLNDEDLGVSKPSSSGENCAFFIGEGKMSD